MMDNNSAAPKSRNARFVPFFIIIVIAVVIGFAIRHFTSSKETLPDRGQLEVYFSEVNGAVSGTSLEERLVNKLTSATAVVDAALYDLDSKSNNNSINQCTQQKCESPSVHRKQSCGKERNTTVT